MNGKCENCAELNQTVERLKAERDGLGSAIAEAAKRAGIYNGEVSLTGPELIMLCDDLAERDAAVAAMRERAAKVADTLEHEHGDGEIGRAIRALPLHKEQQQ